jgi:hypothetical protein
LEHQRKARSAYPFGLSRAVDRFCRDALAQYVRLFRLWRKFRSGQLDRRQLLLRSISIQRGFSPWPSGI